MGSLRKLPLIGFKPCSSMIVSGSSGSGKTRWVTGFIENLNRMYRGNPPVEILFCYAVWQDIYDEIKQISPVPMTFNYGLPSREQNLDFSEDRDHRLIVMEFKSLRQEV